MKSRHIPVGVQKPFFAIVTKNDEEGYVVEEPERMAMAINVTMTPEVADGGLDADDMRIENYSESTSVKVSFNADALDAPVRAKVLGHRIDSSGGLVEQDGDTPPELALMFRISLTGGKYKYVVLYAGSFKEFAETAETKKKGAVNYQTPTIEGEFYKRVIDGVMRYSISTATEGYSNDKVAAWFESVQEPEEDGTEPVEL